MYQESKAEGGFNLCKFKTNSRRIHLSCKSLSSDRRTLDTSTATSIQYSGAQSMADEEQKSVGLRWCVETDHFVLKGGHQERGLYTKETRSP